MVIPLGPTSTVPALREALRTTMDRNRRNLLTAVVSGTALLSLAGSWATSDASARHQPVAGKPVDDELLSLLEDHSTQLTRMATEQRQHTAPLLDAHLTTVINVLEGRSIDEESKGVDIFGERVEGYLGPDAHAGQARESAPLEAVS
ncbi:hypothetical protein ACWGIU_03185 [Streptomyces sp. NPDC054840]